MSNHKRSINDYVKDIPMRFSNTFSQLPTESHLNSLDLSPIRIDRLTQSDYEYSFNVERIAIEDAHREHERIYKAAEERMKNLQLANQLIEKQVKRPVEDVINSSKPIQLTNLPTPANSDSISMHNNYNVYQRSSVNTSYANTVTSNASVFNPTFNTYQDSLTMTNQSNIAHETQLPLMNIRTNVPNSMSMSSAMIQPHQTILANSYLPTLVPSNTSIANNMIGSTNLHASNSNEGQFSKAFAQSDASLSLSEQASKTAPLNSNQDIFYNVSNVSQPSPYTSHNMLAHLMQPTSLPNFTSGPQSTTIYSHHNAYASQSHLNSMNHQSNHPHQLTASQPTISQPFVPTNRMASDRPSQKAQQVYKQNNVPLSTDSNGILLPQPFSSTHTTNLKNSAKKIEQKITERSSEMENKINNSKQNHNSTTISSLRPTDGKKINVVDFENSSSPFDDALLKSIDDKEELNNVFQQLYQNGIK